jgi:pyrroline-5-carboxylate reductase
LNEKIGELDMVHSLKIHMLGVGAMGESIMSGLLAKQQFLPEQINISGRNLEKLERLGKQYGVNCFASNAEAAKASNVIILGCKPYDLTTVSEQLAGAITADTVIISSLAGTAMAELQEKLSHKKVIRLITNIASHLCVGMSIWKADASIHGEQKKAMQALISSIGRDIEVNDEKHIELSTTLSGAGPAVVALFVESLIDANVHIGLPRGMAIELVQETVIGSLQLIKSEEGRTQDVRARVTSPGGVTSRCIAALEERGMRTAMLQAMTAGLRRTVELKDG